MDPDPLCHRGAFRRPVAQCNRSDSKIDYRLTEAAIELVPLIIELGDWGARWLPTTPELAVRAQHLAEGGPVLRDAFMAELRTIHLDHQPPPAQGVLASLSAARQQSAKKGTT